MIIGFVSCRLICGLCFGCCSLNWFVCDLRLLVVLGACFYERCLVSIACYFIVYCYVLFGFWVLLISLLVVCY